MKIFFVCQRVPFPPDRGDKITTYHEITHLAAKHEVHVFCLADGEADLRNLEGARARVASVTAVPFTPASTRWRALKGLLTGQSLSVAAFDFSTLHQAIRARHAELKPDLCMVYSCNVAQYVEPFSDTARIMQFADLDSLKWVQYADRSKGLMRWVYGLESRRLLQYERRIAHQFSRSLVCTDVEKRDFERCIPGVPVDMVANGVDLDYFAPGGFDKQPGAIVFTGVMDYLPNIDAACWFARDILPLVQREVPHARFTVCGSKPVPEVLALAQLPGVEVTGRVPDIRPYMGRAEVFVAPLRMARGVQNKVLEALAAGLPCVSSMAAWSGTVIPQGDGIVATDDPQAFAREVVRLLTDAGYRAQMADRARKAALTHYAWSAQLEKLDRIVDEAVAAQKAKARPLQAGERT